MRRVRVNSKCSYLLDQGEIKLGMEGYIDEEDYWGLKEGQVSVILPETGNCRRTWAFYDYEVDFID